VTQLIVQRVLDRDSLLPWHRVVEAAHRQDYVDLPADPASDSFPMIEREMLREAFEFWICRAAGEVVAAGKLRMPLLDNLDTANVDIRVAPGARRRGYGRSLLHSLQDRVQVLGRSRILMESAGPLDGAEPSPGESFAAAVGALPVTEETRSRLLLDRVDVAELDHRIRALAVPTSSYATVSWIDEAPLEFVAGLAVLSGRMSTDAPLDDLQWEPESWSAERYLDIERLSRERGRRQIATAAVERTTGHVVGITVIGVHRLAPAVAQQSETIVDASHRGHRLGMLLKLVNERQLITHQPNTRAVITWNAAVNAHMIAINEKLGFEPVDRWREWQLNL
jgi:GNAT superfamily N-acetyltransferase